MSNVAIITGAGSGFGLGLAKELTQRGWIVYATDRDSVALEKAKEFGATARRMDVTNRADIDAVVKEAIADHGRIDLMVANAGYGNFSSVEETTPEEVRRIFEVNVFGLQELTARFIPLFRKQGYGRIINVSSVLGELILPF
jgi:NAD(P)-dependent dehydrogenase (short-subunit alcohol dehydrogenase family)